MPEISHELSEVAWCAFRDSKKPAPYNQIRDALEAYEVAKNETAEAAIMKALERLEAIASYQPRPNMKRELRELAEIFRLGLAKPTPSPAGGVREALDKAYSVFEARKTATHTKGALESAINAYLAALSSPATPEPDFPKPGRRDGKEPCGECHIKPDETCDICGARHATSEPVSAPANGEVVESAGYQRRYTRKPPHDHILHAWHPCDREEFEEKRNAPDFEYREVFALSNPTPGHGEGGL